MSRGRSWSCESRDTKLPKLALTCASRWIGTDPARPLPLIGTPIVVAADAAPPVWVSEAAADLYGFAPGKVILKKWTGIRVYPKP